MHGTIRAFLVAILLSGLAACGHVQVELTPEGERVEVVRTLPEVAGCQELGTVLASRSGFADNRDTRTINARNKAAALGGNRILPGKIDLVGVQEFQVFQCPPG